MCQSCDLIFLLIEGHGDGHLEVVLLLHLEIRIAGWWLLVGKRRKTA